MWFSQETSLPRHFCNTFSVSSPSLFNLLFFSKINSHVFPYLYFCAWKKINFRKYINGRLENRNSTENTSHNLLSCLFVIFLQFSNKFLNYLSFFINKLNTKFLLVFIQSFRLLQFHIFLETCNVLVSGSSYEFFLGNFQPLLCLQNNTNFSKNPSKQPKPRKKHIIHSCLK